MLLEGSPRITGAYLGSQSHQLTAMKQTPTRDQLRDPEVLNIYLSRNIHLNVNPEFPKYYGNS
jgi:hypothetical protein